MTEELRINRENFRGNQEDYDSIREAIEKLSSVSQNQFEVIKKEKWYQRVFDMLTFSQKGKIRLAEQIKTIAQAQEIFIELLLRLSECDANISNMVAQSMENIRKIQEQNIYLLSKIKRLENMSLGIKGDMDIDKLGDREKAILCACLYMLGNEYGTTSENQKKFANAVIQYLDTDVQMENPTAGLSDIDNEAKRRMLACCMEYIF